MKPLSKNLLQFFRLQRKYVRIVIITVFLNNSFLHPFSAQEFTQELFSAQRFLLVGIVLFRSPYKPKASGALFLRMLFSFPHSFFYVRFLFSFVYAHLQNILQQTTQSLGWFCPVQTGSQIWFWMQFSHWLYNGICLNSVYGKSDSVTSYRKPFLALKNQMENSQLPYTEKAFSNKLRKGCFVLFNQLLEIILIFLLSLVYYYVRKIQ